MNEIHERRIKKAIEFLSNCNKINPWNSNFPTKEAESPKSHEEECLFNRNLFMREKKQFPKKTRTLPLTSLDIKSRILTRNFNKIGNRINLSAESKKLCSNESKPVFRESFKKEKEVHKLYYLKKELICKKPILGLESVSIETKIRKNANPNKKIKSTPSSTITSPRTLSRSIFFPKNPDEKKKQKAKLDIQREIFVKHS